jgi:hypothetical protein
MNRFATVGIDPEHAPRRRGAPSLWRTARAAVALAVGGWLLASCGALKAEPTLGGETHFLLICEEECGPGLSCIDGVCTRGCEPGYSSCSELAAEATCKSAPDGAERAGFAGTCDVACAADADCASLGASHTCRSGACRADASAALGSTGSLRSALVHAVDADTCRSGLRWMGGTRASAEMLPGSDCVGCHRDSGARPLLVGGTVYTLPSTSGPQPLDDCFGLESIELVIRDSAGREFSTLTNRAGNFYIEGSESELTLPYSAELRWNLDGRETTTAMFSAPSYGGCARCHNDDVTQETKPFEASGDADYVYRTNAIFTPGL